MNVTLSGRNAELSGDLLMGSTLDFPPPPPFICKYTQIFAIKSFLQIYSHTFYTLLRFISLQQLLHIDIYGKLMKNVVSDITTFMFDFPTG
jgi:ABC-type enterochelin transport system permease subunit